MSLITMGFGTSKGAKSVTSITVEVADISINIDISDDRGTIDMISIKQGEAKTISFTLTDSDGDAIDVSGATMSFGVKEQKSDDDYIIEKSSDDFDTSKASNGIVFLSLSSTDTDVEPESYVAELRAEIDSTSIYKSDDIDFIVEESVFN